MIGWNCVVIASWLISGGASTYQIHAKNQDLRLSRRDTPSLKLVKRDTQTVPLTETFDGNTLFQS
jgi:hypothetical protein